MTVLAIDPGTKRVGIAISDPADKFALPLETVDESEIVKRVSELVKERKVDEVVVGHPVRTQGSHGPESQGAQQFADSLRAQLPVPVNLYDERFTTVQATRELHRAGLSGRKMRARIDESAAVVLLQSYLDSKKH